MVKARLSWQRLSLLADGRVLYALRHRWRDGTTHVAFEPLELVEKLAALVPVWSKNETDTDQGSHR